MLKRDRKSLRAGAACLLGAMALAAPAYAARPSILLVVADDMAASLVDRMPTVQALAARGATFTQAYYNDPLCEPSRATILTGQYVQNTRVATNSWGDFAASGDDGRTFAVALHAAGYRTGLVGKYINGYPPEAGIPPGWDRWFVPIDIGYYGGAVDDQGTVSTVDPSTYVSDMLAAKALAFVRQATADGAPFFLELAFHAPHVPSTPAPRDAALPEAGVPRDAAFNEADVSDKPKYVRSHPPLGPSDIADVDQRYENMARSLQSVDRAVAALLAELAADGQAGNTYIVFTSDNGWMSGRHRLGGKDVPYEPSIRAPLVISGPGILPEEVRALVGNVDLAPTFAAWAGAVMPAVDGRSLVPLLADPGVPWRHAYPIVHAYGADNTTFPGYVGLRGTRYAYVEYSDGERELYDMATDPHQLVNIAPTAATALLAQLSALAATLDACAGAACRAAEDAAAARR